MKKTILLSIIFLSTISIPVSAATRLVPDEYSTIQSAIEACNNGDTVIVSPGTYVENVNFIGKRITLTSTEPDNPDIVAATIINANNTGSAVTFEYGENNQAVLTGFTITGGYGSINNLVGYEINCGGGIYCLNSSPTIKNNVITDNHGTLDALSGDESYGAGIFTMFSDAIINCNIITNNSALVGGGIMTYIGDPMICNNLIYENSAVQAGGIIAIGGTLLNNTITSNDASISIAGVTGYFGNAYLTPDDIVKNNIICNAKSGGGLYIEDYGDIGDPLFAYNDVWGNIPSDYAQDTTVMTGRNGNISENPLLSRDFHITYYSPCYNAGDPNYVPLSWQRDIDDEYRVMGYSVDIGADEITESARPIADAGMDRYFDTLVDNVTLDGTGSYDYDTTDVLTYLWQQMGGPEVILGNANSAEPNFSPPVESIYYFKLTVFDGTSYSVPDSVMMVVGNRPPIADAGDDRICEPGEQVILNGINSSDPDLGDVLSYSWTQISGPAGELVNANTATPGFTPQDLGEYVLELVVNDGTDSSLPDTVTVTCIIGSEVDDYGYRWIDSDSKWGPHFRWIDIQETGTKVSGISYSIEECFGPFPLGFDFDFYGNVYDQFYIHSSGLISFSAPRMSVQPIPVDNQSIPHSDQYNNFIAWMWSYFYLQRNSKIYYQHFDGYTVIQFADYEHSYNSGVTNAEVILYPSGKIVIQFKDFSENFYFRQYTIGIENAFGTIGSQVAYNDRYYLHDELAIEFSLGPPYEPVANAGPDQYLDGIELVRLDGTNSNDRDLDDVLTYQWTQIAGSDVVLSDPTAAQPTFMPESEGEYWFQLVVSDGTFTSYPDNVLVVIGNRPPVADAGQNRVISIPGRVHLDGSDSYDLDLTDELTYTWTQLEGPQVVLGRESSPEPYFDCTEHGVYVFELVVNDGLVDSQPSITQVSTINIAVNQPYQVDAGFSVAGYFHYPDISGDKVVYSVGTGDDFSWDIYCKDLRTGDLTSYPTDGIDTQPKISGDMLVWCGGLESSDPWNHEPSNTSIFVRNLANDEQKTIREHTMSEAYSHPVVYGNKVVWLEHLDLDTKPLRSEEAERWWNTPYNICGADISDWDNFVYFTIAENVGTRDPYPFYDYDADFDDVIDIYGNIVVYEGNGDIYGADISNIEDIKVFTICSDPARQYDPAISGDIVVWTDKRNDSGDIYGADISDSNNIREFAVIKNSGTQQQPAICGRLIAYVYGSSYSGTIRACYLTRNYCPIDVPLSRTRSSYGCGLVVSGQTIVWQTSSYGQIEAVSLDFSYSTYSGPVQNIDSGEFYDYIQCAIDGALEGEQIVVDSGLYYENISAKGSNIVISSTNPDDPAVVAATIINAADGFPVVTYGGGQDANSIITGFTITGSDDGIACYDASSPTISKCRIIGNLDNGIHLFNGCDPVITNCDIIYNTGTGLRLDKKPLRSDPFNQPVIANCVIAGNDKYGIFRGKPTVINCTIADNLFAGIYKSTAVVTNSIIYFNGDYSAADQLTSGNFSTTYSNVQGSAAGTGNIDADPLFADTLLGDYHLLSQTGRWDPITLSWIQDAISSPCIDTGDPSSDYSAEPAPNGSAINMGAYGGTAQASKSP